MLLHAVRAVRMVRMGSGLEYGCQPSWLHVKPYTVAKVWGSFEVVPLGNQSIECRVFRTVRCAMRKLHRLLGENHTHVQCAGTWNFALYGTARNDLNTGAVVEQRNMTALFYLRDVRLLENKGMPRGRYVRKVCVGGHDSPRTSYMEATYALVGLDGMMSSQHTCTLPRSADEGSCSRHNPQRRLCRASDTRTAVLVRQVTQPSAKRQ